MVAKARGDLFDVSMGGAGFHFTSHLIAIVALFIACFAIAGYISYRSDSIPATALKDGDPDFDDIKATSLTLTGALNAPVITPVSLPDGNLTLTAATHGGRVLLVPNATTNNTYTLPAPVAGTTFRFVYAGGAADTENTIIVTPSNTNFYIGGVTFLDSANTISSVFSNGSSNSELTLADPSGFDVTIVAVDATNYQVLGNVTSGTTPAFADQ